MKNKGFTLVEVLAVIIILGILSSMVVIGVSKYRQDVKEKELINLHSTIEEAYDNYRSDLVIKGGIPNTNIVFDTIDDATFDKYFSEFTYSGSRLTKEDLKGSSFALRIKGTLITDQNYLNDNRDYVKDGTCLVESKVVKDETESDKSTIEKSCVKDGNNKPKPSQEEILCVNLKKGNEVLIDDYIDDASMEPLCRYFNE